MLTRLTHAAIAFAVTAVLYQCYFLTVVPFIEPAWTTTASADSAEQFVAGADALDKHRELLAAYFPPTHWCFAQPPKTLENGQVLIVYNKADQSASGEMTVPRCAVVFFPRGFEQGAPPPSDAIVLESTQGAVLQMEAAANRGASAFGRIQFGQLKGEVTVRSDMRESGPQDDLLIKTRELYLNEDLIRTDQPVDIRLGEHHGFGRELEIRRLKTEKSAGGGMGLYGSFEDLVIKHDVSFSATPGQSKLLGNTTVAAATSPAPPIRIKSAGPFRIDFGSYKATFEDQVRTWQLHPDGKMDELLADKLTLFFAKATRWNADGADVTPTPSGILGDSSLTFEPASLEALGTPESPVLLKAPSQEASATGERLFIDMVGGRMSRITLEGGEEAVLTHRGAEIHARTLVYQLPAVGSGRRLGTMLVRGGGGWLRAVIDPARPEQILEVSWQEAMQLIRGADGQPVLVLDGRPKVQLTGMGTLWADQLQLFLRELPSGVASLPAMGDAASLSSSIVPERITATGRVGIESTELTGKVNQLVIKIDQQANTPIAGVATGDSGRAAASSPFALGGNVPRRTYNIEGVTLEIDAVLRDRRPDVQAIRVDGGVVFEESAAAGTATPPLRIVAEHLRVTGADTPNAQIEILGGGGQNGVPPQDAEITAGGAEIRAPALRLNRGTSEALINSPGTLKLMVDRDMTGNPLPTPQPLDIAWQESMKLEGRRITFLGDVRVKNESGWLRTRKLVAQTTNNIRFDGAGGQGPPQLEQLECWEGAVAEFDQRDISGVTSRQHIEVQSLTANQLTGALAGMGPGFIDSVHLSKGPAALLALPAGGGVPAPGLVQAEPELRHLHIDFVRDISGNLHTSTVAVHGDVQAVYGPVANWDERLAMSPGGDPGPNVVWITSDMLGVTESPMAQVAAPKVRQFELTAEGRVTIESQDPRQGAFTAYGHRAKYDQSKGNFILEGDGTTPATIERQQFPGGPSSPQKAQYMEYNHVSGRIKIGGLEQGQFQQFDFGRQPATPPP